MSAEVEVFAFDVLGAGFSDEVDLLVKALGIAFPMVGVKLLHAAASKFLAQLATTRIGAAPDEESGDTPGAAIEGIPQPILLFFILHKRPLLIDFQLLDARRHARFGRDGGGLAQRQQDRCRTDAQDTGDVTHARTVEGHGHDQLAQKRVASAISVTQRRQKLSAALCAAIPLLVLKRCAILFVVARATSRTGYF